MSAVFALRSMLKASQFIYFLLISWHNWMQNLVNANLQVLLLTRLLYFCPPVRSFLWCTSLMKSRKGWWDCTRTFTATCIIQPDLSAPSTAAVKLKICWHGSVGLYDTKWSGPYSSLKQLWLYFQNTVSDFNSKVRGLFHNTSISILNQH